MIFATAVLARRSEGIVSFMVDVETFVSILVMQDMYAPQLTTGLGSKKRCKIV